MYKYYRWSPISNNDPQIEILFFFRKFQSVYKSYKWSPILTNDPQISFCTGSSRVYTVATPSQPVFAKWVAVFSFSNQGLITWWSFMSTFLWCRPPPHVLPPLLPTTTTTTTTNTPTTTYVYCRSLLRISGTLLCQPPPHKGDQDPGRYEALVAFLSLCLLYFAINSCK